jgi:YHS domain-containing protein
MNSTDEVIDPVCGMTFRKALAPLVREHGGETFYLCSVECGAKFDGDADAYVAASRLALPGWGQTPHPENVVKQFRKNADAD